LNILAIDTSGKSSGIIYEKDNHRKEFRKAFIAEDIPSLLKENNVSINDIDAIGICIGPGSFTGIRVGISFVKAIRLVRDIPIFGISSFDAMVEDAEKTGILLPIIRLRRGYYSASIYKGNPPRAQDTPKTYTDEELKDIIGNVNYVLTERDFAPLFEARFEKVDILSGVLSQLKKKIKNGASQDVEIEPFYGAHSIAEEKRMKKGIRFIPAQREHLDKIIQIENNSFLYPWDRETFEKILKHPLRVFLVGMKDNEVLGYIIAMKEWDEMHIMNLAVKEEYRNKGIGRSLLHLVIKEAKRMGIKAIYLEVRINNDVAINLYKSFGFSINRVIPGYYYDKEDAVVMELSLGEVP